MLKQLLIFCFCVCFASSLSNEYSYQMAKAAKIAYHSQQVIEKWICKLCDPLITDIIYVSHKQAKIQGFVGYSFHQKSIIISIRGSSEIRNWISNIDIKKIEISYCKGCSVHQGFYKLSQLIYDPIKLAIQKLRKKYEKEGKISLLLTGHSLGGALSTLVGSKLIQSQGMAAKLITFGAPRIGNRAFAEYVSSHFVESYRIVYRRDSIPHLPIRSLGYVHADTEIWFEFINKKKQCSGDKARRCSNSISFFLLKSSDHCMDNYVDIFYDASKENSSFSNKQQGLMMNKAQGLQGYQIIKILSNQTPYEDLITNYDG